MTSARSPAKPPSSSWSNVILLEALRLRASDVHLESTAQGLRVRYRIDGVLQEVSNPPRQYQAAVISRIKIMASFQTSQNGAWPRTGGSACVSPTGSSVYASRRWPLCVVPNRNAVMASSLGLPLRLP